ncbi:Gfo/Idh/MocA family oxidoreductase [Mycoplasmatota bacterium]|nr:Gfo/Idh/MocA family oxidoreductase [Mycoplasmatota bacterium]
MKKFKTAIVGVGFIGVAHIEALRRLGNIEVVAICDQFDIEKKAKQLNVSHYYTDYKEMIEKEDLDFIHICTPNNTHYDIASYAMNKHINIVLEKPMTVTAEEAKKLLVLSKALNVTAAVNFHNRLYPATSHIKHMISNNQIGHVFSIQGVYIQDWLLYQTDYSWRLNSKTSGKTRAVADIGSHWLDLMEYMTGQKIVEVLAEFQTVYPTRKKATQPLKTFETASSEMTYDEMPIDTEDVAVITFKTNEGSLGNVYVSQMAAGKKNRIQLLISGEKASIEWSLDDLSNISVGYRDQANKVITKDQLLMPEVQSLIDYPTGHMEGFPDAFKQNFKNIYYSSTHPDALKRYAGFEDGLRQMVLNDKIYESANDRKWVKIDD